MKIIYPEKIKMAAGKIRNAELLLKEKDLQIGLTERETTEIKGCGYIVLDFGKELSGGVRILTESCAELGEKNATNDHSLRDMTIELQELSDMRFGNTGFRFVRIDTLSEDIKIKLKSIIAISEIDEREEAGRFECDDETINKIWTTAAYTLRLCLQNGYFWDGIKRDRLVWIGDLYPEMKAALNLYEQVPEIENSLRYAKNQAGNGEWINNIPMYSMWWLIVLSENYRYRADDEFVKEQLPYIEELISQFDAYVSAEGETLFKYNFIDWPTHDEEGESREKREDERTGVNYLLRIALQKTKEVLKNFGADIGKTDRLLKRLSAQKKSVNKYKQIAALGVLAGEKTEKNRKLLMKGGAEGLSTFMSYEILTAQGIYGEYKQALENLKKYYGGMLKMGATAFWEDFDIKWMENASGIDKWPKEGEKDIHGDYGAFCYKGFRHSLCHGWSVGVLAYLLETVLGLMPSRMNFRTVRFKPNPSGLRYAKGSLPTPFGIIEAEWFLTSKGEIEKHILRAPKEIEIVEE